MDKLQLVIQSGVEVRFPANTDRADHSFMCILSRRGISVAATGKTPDDAFDVAVDKLDEARGELGS